MTIQSLEHEVDRILGKHSVHFNYSKAETRAALLKTVDRYVEGELKTLRPDGKNMSTTAYALWVQNELESRLLALRQQVKGGE